MPIALYRIDDRLIHGQVVVGWGQPLELGFLVLVDDEVAASEWEQELYRMGVPPEMSVQFYTVTDAAAHLPELQKRPETGIVLVGDHLYGDSDDAGIPFCAELMTGNVVWKKRGSGKGSATVVAADGHLYVRFADGTLALAKADPADYVELATFKIPGSDARPSWSHSVILDGRLFLREQDKILCYDLRK